MTLAAEGTDYGSLNALVHAASTIVSAGIAIGVLWWKRPTLADVHEGLIKTGEVVLTAIGIVLIWVQFSELSSTPALIKWIEVLALGLLISLIVLTILTVGWSVLRDTDTPHEARVLGGFWLTPNGRQAKQKFGSVQEAYAGFMFNAADLWSIPSRVVAQILFLIFDLLAAICGSVGLTATAMLLLIYQVPRIYEFSVSPVVVEVNATTTIHWSVSGNATKVELDPFGDVAGQGARIETVAKGTDFKLTASNSFGSRNVEQSVSVHTSTDNPPAPPRTASRTKHPPTPQPKHVDIIIEARTCSLVQNVVIRGAGWLEAENEKDSSAVSRAECSVQIEREAKYEIFITYAANDNWPVRVALNQHIIDDAALAASTGGWDEPNQKEQPMGVWPLNSGTNTVEFYREHPIPHIQRIRFRLSS